MALATLAGVGGASAQEGGYDWSGLYIGAHAGKAFGETDVEAAITGESRTCFFGCSSWTAYSIPDPAATSSADVRGMVGGALVGYNLQWGRLVVGAEADINASDARSDPAALFSAFGGVVQVGSFSTELDWYGTVRGRVGLDLADGLMVYGTGGLAYGSVTNSIGYTFGPLSESFSASETRTGWTAGGGMEVALFNSSRLRLKTEYLYTDLGGSEFFNQSLPNLNVILLQTRENQAAASADLRFHTVRVGINLGF